MSRPSYREQQVAEGLWGDLPQARGKLRAFGAPFGLRSSPLFSGVETRTADTDLAPCRPPNQIWQVDAADVQPSRLTREVPVVALLDTARPSALEVCRDPSARLRRLVETVISPCVGRLGVLDNAAPAPDSIQRRAEAAAICAKCQAWPLRGIATPEAAPAFAGRMRNYWMGASIKPRVARFVPGIDARQPEVASSGLDIERGYHLSAPTSSTSSATPSTTTATVTAHAIRGSAR